MAVSTDARWFEIDTVAWEVLNQASATEMTRATHVPLSTLGLATAAREENPKGVGSRSL